MKLRIALFLFAFLASAMGVLAQDDAPPTPKVVAEAMKQATAFYRTNLSYAGGYAREWSRDLRESHVEDSSGTGIISIQPDGTTTVGLAMLRAYEVTQDPLFLQGATEAADALAWCQLASGGWDADFSYELRNVRNYHFRRDIDAGDMDPGKRRAPSSLDDGKTQSAIRFLSAFAKSPAGADNDRLQHSLKFAWDGLLAAQAPNGAWPQAFTGPADVSLAVKKASIPADWSRQYPDEKYTHHYTLNDGNLVSLLELLLENDRVEEAKRLGEFILLAQLPEPQPAWAQQYDDKMQPTWARKFEPPSVASIETLGAVEILTRLSEATGDQKWVATVPAALDWLEQRELSENPGTWARFYELETDKPLYFTADSYELTYDDANLPTHYGFQVRITSRIKQARERLADGPEIELSPESKKDWAKRAEKLASAARTALEQQKPEGYWVKGDPISAGEFVKHMEALTLYLDARQNAETAP